MIKKINLSEQFCLKCNEFGSTVSDSFKDFRSNNDTLQNNPHPHTCKILDPYDNLAGILVTGAEEERRLIPKSCS